MPFPSDKIADFDHIADSYDHSFTHTEIGRRQRARVWNYLNKQLPSDIRLRILEVNCGTGEDAVFLAQKGHDVTATDISEEMTKVAQKKLANYSFKGKANTQAVAAQDLTKHFSTQSFDYIFSNFGGLNCLNHNDLQQFSAQANDLLKAKGHLIAVVMPSFCVWETFYFLLKRNRQQAFRRRSKTAVLANVEAVQVPTWYYSPSDFAQYFSPYFTIKKIIPIGIALPPSYLEPFFKKHLYALKLLNLLEKPLSKFSFLAALADHYLIDLEKKA